MDEFKVVPKRKWMRSMSYTGSSTSFVPGGQNDPPTTDVVIFARRSERKTFFSFQCYFGPRSFVYVNAIA